MTRSVHGFPVVVLASVLTLALAVVEAFVGPAAAADAVLGLAVLLALVTVVALVVRRTGRNRSSGPATALSGLALVAILLLVVAVVVVFRAHTASSRFEVATGEFPLPGGYRPVPADGFDSSHDQEAERVVRGWEVPQGVDVCADIDAAFRAWAKPPVEASSRGESCVLDSEEQTEKAQVSVSRDGSTVFLEMWLDQDPLVDF